MGALPTLLWNHGGKGAALVLFLAVVWLSWWLAPVQSRWSWQPGKRLHLIGYAAGGSQVAVATHHYSNRGSFPCGPVHIFDTQTGQELHTLLDGGQWMDVGLSPDGKFLLIQEGIGKQARQQTLTLYELSSGQEYARLALALAPNTNFAFWDFSPDGQTLVYTDRQEEQVYLRCWDIPNRSETAVLPHVDGMCTFSPDGRWIVAGDSFNRLQGPEYRGIRIWEWKQGQKLATLRDYQGTTGVLTFSPDGTMLAAAIFDDSSPAKRMATVKVWEIDSTRELATLKECFHPCFSADSSTLATSAYDKNGLRNATSLWDTTNWQLRTIKDAGPDRSDSMQGMPLNVSTNRRIVLSHGYQDEPGRLAQWIAPKLGWSTPVGVQINEVRLLDPDTGTITATIAREGGGLYTVFAPDAKSLALLHHNLPSDDGDILELWDVPPRKPLEWLLPAWAGLAMGLVVLCYWRRRVRVNASKAIPALPPSR